jgi:hypothetical protein
MEFECTGCQLGVQMCYNRPCMGTPEEFDKILDAGFAKNLHLEYWVRSTEEGGDIYMLSGSIYPLDEKEQLRSFLHILLTGKQESPLEQDRTKLSYFPLHTGGMIWTDGPVLSPLGYHPPVIH